MARFQYRKGAEEIEKAVASAGTGSYAPTLRWSEDKEVHYVQFLDPIEDVPSVLMHIAMIVGHYESGKEMRRDFVSPLDPAVLEGMGLTASEANDPLAERGYQPKERNIFRVVELEPVYAKGSGGRKKITDFDFAFREYENKDGETVEVPNVAFICESPHIFGNYLKTLDDTDPIMDSIWKVTQSGVKKDKKFVFERVPGVEPLDLSEIEAEIEDLGDIDAFLDERADEERLASFVDDKPDDWVFNEWGGPKKGKKNESSSSSRGRGRTRAAETTGDEEGEPGPEEEPEEEPKSRRSRAARREAATTGSGGRRKRDFTQMRQRRVAAGDDD